MFDMTQADQLVLQNIDEIMTRPLQYGFAAVHLFSLLNPLNPQNMTRPFKYIYIYIYICIYTHIYRERAKDHDQASSI